MLLIEPKGPACGQVAGDAFGAPYSQRRTSIIRVNLKCLRAASLAAEVIKNRQLEKHPIFIGTAQIEHGFTQQLTVAVRGWWSAAIALIAGKTIGPPSFGRERVWSRFRTYRHLPRDAQNQTREAQPTSDDQFRGTGSYTCRPSCQCSRPGLRPARHKAAQSSQSVARKFLESKLADLRTAWGNPKMP